MIYGWTGTPGAGKTREMLHQLVLELERILKPYRKATKLLFLLKYLFFLRRLTTRFSWCTPLVKRYPFLSGLYRRYFRKIWRFLFSKISPIKLEKLVPVIFINFYDVHGNCAINLEFWEKRFPEINFIIYPLYKKEESEKLLSRLIGKWDDPQKTPVFPSIWVFDELQQFFPKRGTNAPPTSYEQFFEKHRHFGVNVYFTTQGMKLLSPHFRELMEKHYHITNPFRNGLVRILEFTGCEVSPSKKLAAKSTTKKQATYIFKAYTSSVLHLEKKGFPIHLKLAVLALLGFFALFLYKVFVIDADRVAASQNPPATSPQQLTPSGQVPVSAHEVRKESAPQVAQDKKSQGTQQVGLDAPNIKPLTGFKKSSFKNPFSEYGVSDPTHVSFHGFIKILGKTAYRVCFYVTTQWCAWIEDSSSQLIVKKFFSQTVLMWDDWVIPQTKEGLHPQLDERHRFSATEWGGKVTSATFDGTAGQNPQKK